MNNQLEQYLREMGLFPSTDIESLEEAVCPSLIAHRLHMTKGYFNDPRDPITGEVSF
jgi:hypothetical protein